MLSKVHLTSHSRMSGSRWVITISWLSGSCRSFWYSSSVYSCQLLLISSASVRSIQFLSYIMPIFAWNVPLVSLMFLKRSRLSCSIVFLYFFALITEEDFPISPCYFLELYLQMVISFLGNLAELFHILKDDAVKVLHSMCHQIWKTHQWPLEWKRSFSFQSQRRTMPKNAPSTTFPMLSPKWLWVGTSLWL